MPPPEERAWRPVPRPERATTHAGNDSSLHRSQVCGAGARADHGHASAGVTAAGSFEAEAAAGGPLSRRARSSRAAEGAAGREPSPARAAVAFVERLPLAALAAAALAVAALTLLLPSAPTYDPWSWINWGREVVGLGLDTRGGPAWKPLPVLFTAPFSVAGDGAPYLWLAVARAGGLLALAMTFRVASRLAGGERRPGTALLAGSAAVLALASSSDLVRDVALGSSEGLLAALALVAFERHLDGRVDHALAATVAVALLRPEAWPFLLVYAAYAWTRLERRRWLVVALVAPVPLLWFLPELWGSGELLRSAGRARVLEPDSPALADHPALAVLRDFARSLIAPVALAALAAVALAVRRPRAEPATLALALLGGAWVLLVAAMTQAGYPGETRYLVAATAAASVLAGVGLARLAAAGAAALGRLALPRAAATLAAVAVVGLAVGAIVALALPRAKLVPRVARGLGQDARVWHDLRGAVSRAGGRTRLLRCGPAYAAARYVPMVAWELRLRGIEVGLEPRVPGVVAQLPERQGGRALPAAGRRFRLLAAAGEARLRGACAASPAGGGA
jgi:hypothetical protein